MEGKIINRRQFIEKTSAGTIGVVALSSIPFIGKTTNISDKLAILGGEPIVKNKVCAEMALCR